MSHILCSLCSLEGQGPCTLTFWSGVFECGRRFGAISLNLASAAEESGSIPGSPTSWIGSGSRRDCSNKVEHSVEKVKPDNWIRSIIIHSFHRALFSKTLHHWVKSGNGGNLKCLKENDHYALIFHRKMFIAFFLWYKTVKSFWLIFGFDHICQIFEKLYAKNMKGGSEKSEILCVGQLARAEKK